MGNALVKVGWYKNLSCAYQIGHGQIDSLYQKIIYL